MNHVADNTRLFRQLTLADPQVLARLAALAAITFAAASSTGPGWAGLGWAVAVMVLLASAAPTWERYQAIGLGSAYWRGHHRILVIGIALLLLVEAAVLWALTAFDINPWFPLALVVGAGVALLRKGGASPQKVRSGAVPSLADRVRFPLTPVVQMIRVPQLTAWAFLWGGAPVLIVILALLVRFARLESDLAGIFFTIVFVQGVFVISGEFGRSFREWVGFGGHRSVWARETAAMGVVNPVCALLFAGLAALVSSRPMTTEMVVIPVYGALLLAIVVVLAELADRRAWWLPLVYVVVGNGIVALWATSHLPLVMVLVAGVALYLVHALTLPAVARRSVPGSSGVSTWLGLRANAGT